MLRVAAFAAWSLLASVSSLALNTASAGAIGPTVTGAGSTWVAIALRQWEADISKQGYSINYQPNGSSFGRSFFIANQRDFAASEIPFQPDEVAQLQGEHKSYQYLPDVAGGTSLMYNLHSPSGSRITGLRLDGTTAAKIFTGVITSWQDPAIQALNPGLPINETAIKAVIRSDGSGTSAQFSLYIASQAPAVWSAFVSNPDHACQLPCSQWPPFDNSIQQSGSDGVANFVGNDAIGMGAIGYVEAGFAFERHFPVASMRNASGHFAQPSPGSVAVALTHAQLNADLTQKLEGVYNAPEASAYPMSSYSYMITQTSGFDPAKGAVLGTWIIYIACHGQTEADRLGYSPLPPNLVADVFAAVRRIPGAPAPPPVDAAHCDNPTITGAAAGGSAGHGAAGAGGRTTAAAASAAAAAAATAAAAASASTSADQSTLAPAVATLDDAQRRALLAQAERIAGAAGSHPPYILLVAAAVTIAGVFAPMLLWRRRRAHVA